MLIFFDGPTLTPSSTCHITLVENNNEVFNKLNFKI